MAHGANLVFSIENQSKTFKSIVEYRTSLTPRNTFELEL